MDSQKDTDSEANQKPADPAVPSPIPVAPSKQAGPADKDEELSEERANITVNVPPNRTRPVEWWQLGISAVLAVVGVFAICIYGGQLQVMKGQLSVTRDELVGTQAAVVSVVSLGIDEHNGIVIVGVRNNGHVTSSRFTGRFTIARETLPERKTIGAPIIRTIEPRPLQVGQDGAIQEIYPIPNLGIEGWDSIKKLEQAIVVEWDFNYDNGFEEVVHDHRCMLYLYSDFQVRDGQVVGFLTGNGFIPCESFEAIFKAAANFKKKAETEATTKKAPKKPN